MVKCNVKSCEELAPVQRADCTNEQYIHLCYKHSAEYEAGVLQLGDMDIDHYQKWCNQ